MIIISGKQKIDTLCWTCKKVGRSICEWDRKLKPVKGWKAEPTKIWNSMKKEEWTSYRVIECPMYEGK